MSGSKSDKRLQDEEWLQKGVDIWLIRDNLSLSFEGRIAQHQNMLRLIDELKEIGSKNHARSSSPPQTAGSQPH
ncbi:MAG: hypothetical protein HYU99_10000 [Deltaproteobacteria bacterium]|nr:hypothetical protein [Deltaproteobacteria bacterium]